jgi:hypothetical protein
MTNTTKWGIAAVSALALALLTLNVDLPWPALGAAAAAPATAACPANAKPANLNFTLKDTSNRDVNLSAFKGKVVLLEDHSSPSVYVAFPVISDLSDIDPRLAAGNWAVVIWTTTPWTLPANLAIAFHPDYEYSAIIVAGKGYIVAPGRGSRSTFATRSRLIDPTTESSKALACDAGQWRSRGLGSRDRLSGKCAQVERRAFQVLAQVEQARPKRRSVRDRLDPSHVGKALQRTDEHGELEIGLRDPRRADAHPGPLQHRRPVDQLTRSGTAVPGPSFGPLGLELQQVPIERPAEAGNRGLGAVGSMAQRGLARAGSRRIRVTARPALEQPAEGEGGGLARAELADETERGRPLRRVIVQHVRPAGLSRS